MINDIQNIVNQEWSWHENDSQDLIISEDFTTDVALHISGDWGNPKTKNEYKEYVALALNHFNDELIKMGSQTAYLLAASGKLKVISEIHFKESDVLEYVPPAILNNSKMYAEWLKGFKAFATT